MNREQKNERRLKRHNQRIVLNKKRKQERRKTKYCDNCGGSMTWCNSCQMYSRNCCEDYGSCMCS